MAKLDGTGEREKKTKRREQVGTKRQGRQDKAGGRRAEGGTDEMHRVKSEARRSGDGRGKRSVTFLLQCGDNDVFC